jgi:hypothetical protein
MQHYLFVIGAVVAGAAALLIGAHPGVALAAAALAGEAGRLIAGRLAARGVDRRERALADTLMAYLIDMGDALQEVSIERLQQRGGWDRALFDSVLAHVEKLTPGFQDALIDYLRPVDGPRSGRVIAALLAVDRLSAAYTYWTRLFPPGKQEESMFVLSLLQDLSEKVEARSALRRGGPS